MHRLRLPIFLILAFLALIPLLPAEASSRTRPPPRKARVIKERRAYGGELGLRGGPFFRLNTAVVDTLSGNGPLPALYAIQVSGDIHLAFHERLSAWGQLGYAVRRDSYASAVDPNRPDLALTLNRVHLFHVGLKARPFLKRVSPYLVAGLGPDLLVYAPQVGGFGSTLPLVGLGVQVGGGVDLMFTPKVGMHLDVRNVLSIHARQHIDDYVDTLEGEETVRTYYYKMDFRSVEDSLELSLGLTLRL